ncbi:uncharacterized protein N7503_007733 [Penicillium pulvis]|uniref:uncharacterized protein n=1 Tax=Penicillium pulvis TaxID=1562058 RepID=UPI0025476C8A|nr:uncharacterized protein N7503_007733 [Penicillium pulvis]KAJ5798437.1 hypothetical protein N7503_007733 [Penicillium pulvis]
MSSWYLDWGVSPSVPHASAARNTAPQLRVPNRQAIRLQRTDIQHETAQAAIAAYRDRVHPRPVPPSLVTQDTAPPQLPQTSQLTIPNALVIPPPPNDILYETTEAAIAAMNVFAKPYGFAISTMSCTSWQGTRQIVYLCCRQERKRRMLLPPGYKRTGIDCPFPSILRLQADGRWLVTLPNATHNHGIYTGSTHIIHRRTEVTQKAALIDAQIRRGKGPTAILRFLRDEDPTTCILVQDIKAYRKKALKLAAREQALSTPAFMGPYQVSQPK